jgi:hypothetical protein
LLYDLLQFECSGYSVTHRSTDHGRVTVATSTAKREWDFQSSNGDDMMNGNLRVGNLFGIPFFINVSWFLVLAFVTVNFGEGLIAQFPALGTAAWVLGLIAGLLLFASVLLHELGHSIAAQQQGIGVNSITLFLFGGLASISRSQIA